MQNLKEEQRIALRRQIYLAIRDAAQLGKKCPSLRVLGEHCGLNHKTITRALQKMHDDGLVEIRGRTHGRAPVVYVPEIDKETAPVVGPKRPAPTGKKGNFRLFVARNLESRPAVDTDAMLYGGVLSDVQFLRRRGFGIHKEATGFRVGNALVSASDIVAKAARERRLAGVAQ